MDRMVYGLGGWMGGWLDRWMDPWIFRCIDKCFYLWLDRWINVWIYCMYICMYVWMETLCMQSQRKTDIIFTTPQSILGPYLSSLAHRHVLVQTATCQRLQVQVNTENVTILNSTENCPVIVSLQDSKRVSLCASN